MITQQFKDRLTMLLNQRAAEDELFAQALKKENKSIDECCKYVMGGSYRMVRQKQGFSPGDGRFGGAGHGRALLR
jgi:hypothetical protein